MGSVIRILGLPSTDSNGLIAETVMAADTGRTLPRRQPATKPRCEEFPLAPVSQRCRQWRRPEIIGESVCDDATSPQSRSFFPLYA